MGLEGQRVGAFRIPTDALESDGTYEWDHTTLVVTEIASNGQTGVGYTYAGAGVALMIEEQLTGVLKRHDLLDTEAVWHDCYAQLRNEGRQGASSAAVSAVDVALWDLKAKLLGVPLVKLFGQVREALPLYGSGGFTSYSDRQLQQQFEGWAQQGISRFKMKVGRNLDRDPARVGVARATIGASAELFVDANSAYTCAQAREIGERFAQEFGVRWLEEPLLPEDIEGMHYLRDHLPAGMELAEGEYGYDVDYFRRLLAGQAVDVAMADATRCGGITGFFKIAHFCAAQHVPLSSHCAPALHVHPGCAVEGLRHAEYFHDHERIEQMLFEGTPMPVKGALYPNLNVAGHGLIFKWKDAERYAVKYG